jgi:lysophospholipase L1-like esterase
VLPLGDSLTLGYGSAREGLGSEGGYRIRLRQLLDQAGLAVEFVGTQANGPRSLVNNRHEGYNGFTIREVSRVGRTACAALSPQPQVALLLAGTNDVLSWTTPGEAAADLEGLIEDLGQQVPGIKLVVAQLIPAVYNREEIESFNAKLPALVERQRSRGLNVRLVNMYGIGLESIASDGVHPTLAGYDRMADVWFPALRDVLEELNELA